MLYTRLQLQSNSASGYIALTWLHPIRKYFDAMGDTGFRLSPKPRKKFNPKGDHVALLSPIALMFLFIYFNLSDWRQSTSYTKTLMAIAIMGGGALLGKHSAGGNSISLTSVVY